MNDGEPAVRQADGSVVHETSGVGPDASDADVDRDHVRTSIVVPAYNEAGNVGPLTEELLATFDGEAARPHGPFEVVFVDDGSTDGTRERLVELADAHPRVRAVLLRGNFGQSGALAAGVDHAAGDRVVTMDGDRQNDPADVPRLLDALEEGYDCVKGWRRDRRDPLRKRLPSAVQTRLAWLTGPRIHDYVCGIAAYRTEAIRDVAIYGESHRYVPAMLHRHGYRVTERRVNHRPRAEGRTKYGPRRLLRGFVDLLFYTYWVRFADRPMHAFGGAGVVVFGVAVTAVVASVAAAAGGLFDPQVAAVVVAVLASTGILLAVVLGVAGVVLETGTHRYFGTERPYRVLRVTDGSGTDKFLEHGRGRLGEGGEGGNGRGSDESIEGRSVDENNRGDPRTAVEDSRPRSDG